MKTVLNIFLIILTTYLMACSETESTATEASFSMQLSNSSQAKRTADSFSITDAGGTTFVITEARANVRHIEFDMPSGSTDSTKKFIIDGPFVIDLMNGTSMPAVGDFEIKPGIYKRIDVRLDDSKLSDGLISNSDDLMNATLILKGTFNYNSTPGRNFTLILKFNEDIRFQEAGGIIVREDQANEVIINLHVDEWLQDVNITDCINTDELILDVNGDLHFDDNNVNDNCDAIEKTLKKNIKTKYVLDDNHNEVIVSNPPDDGYDDGYDDGPKY